MTGSGDAVTVEIRAIVDKFIEDMKKAGTAAGDAGRQVADGAREMGEGAKGAQPHVFGLGDALKHYRGEVRQEARLSRFLAADIASMGIASKGAAGEITQFLGAFAIGGLLGGAIEGVKFLVTKMNEVTHEEEAAKAALQKYSDDGVANLKKITTEVDNLVLSKKQLRLAEVVGPMVGDLVKLQNEMTAANDKYVKQQQLAEQAANSAGMKGVEREKFLAAMTKEKAEAVELVTAAYEKQQLIVDAGKAQVEREFKLSAQLAEAERERKEHAAAFSAELDYRRDSLIAENVIDTALLIKDAQRAQAEWDAAHALEAAERAYRDMEREAENVADFDVVFADSQQRAADALKDQKKEWQEIHPAVSMVAGEITQMLFDAKSLDDVLKDIARQVVQTAIQFALKAAALSIFGFEHGGDVPSAAAGWDVPSTSGAIPAVLHPREMVLPEKYADVIRGAAAAGGGGMNITIHAMDAQGVRQFVGSREFAQAMREAQRSGRL